MYGVTVWDDVPYYYYILIMSGIARKYFFGFSIPYSSVEDYYRLYRTVSSDVLEVITGIPLYNLLIQEK